MQKRRTMEKTQGRDNNCSARARRPIQAGGL